MPLRGETIGTAFVRVLMDGDGFKESIRDGLDKNEDMFSAAGDEDSEAYQKAFKKRMEDNDEIEKSMSDKIQKGFAKMNADAEHFGVEWQRKLGKELAEGFSFDDEGLQAKAELIGNRMATKIAEGINRTGVRPDMGKALRPLLASTIKEIQDEEEKLARAAEKAARAVERQARTNKNADGSFKNLGDSVGKMFGKGGRNDFVNIVGSVVGGITKLTLLVPKAATAFMGLFKSSSAASGAVEGLADSAAQMASQGGAASKAFSSLAASAPALAIVAVAIAGAVSVATALISGLAAAVTALVSSLAFAAAGAVAPLVGALLPLGAAIGVGVLAFTNMDKASKKLLKESLKPITEEFKVLGKVAAKSFTGSLTENAGRFHTALAGLKPLVKGVADAMGDVMTGFAKSLNSPAFAAFKAEMGAFLPNAVRMLGTSITNALGGMGGIFRALVPITNQFLGWLQKITGEFSKWANSKEGQESLKRFFEQAGQSAKTVGKFIKTAAVALGELFTQGRGSGDSIFKSVTGALQDFVDYLQNPANRQAIADFFKNGISVAQQLGGIIQGAITLFNLLDNSLSRGILMHSLNGIAFAFGAVNWAIRQMLQPLGIFLAGLAKTFGLLSHVPGFGWLASLSQGLGTAAADLVNTDTKVRTLSGTLNGLPKKVQLAVQSVGFEPTMAKMMGLARQFHLTPKQLKIIAAANGFDLTNKRLKTLTAAAKETGKQKPTVKAKADVKDAQGKLKGLGIAAKTLAGVSKPVTVKAKTDSAKATGDMNAFGRKADSTGKKKPSVTITVHNAAALANIRAVDRAMDGLSSKTITITTVHAHVTRGKATATGGIFRSAQTRLIGEAGPEAVVPLARNLNQVDPAVRSLSAFAQGKGVDSSTTNNGKVFNFTEGSIQVQSNADNAKTVAAEFVNRLAAVGY